VASQLAMATARTQQNGENICTAAALGDDWASHGQVAGDYVKSPLSVSVGLALRPRGLLETGPAPCGRGRTVTDYWALETALQMMRTKARKGKRKSPGH
jgi:hypothetical protein